VDRILSRAADASPPLRRKENTPTTGDLQTGPASRSNASIPSSWPCPQARPPHPSLPTGGSEGTYVPPEAGTAWPAAHASGQPRRGSGFGSRAASRSSLVIAARGIAARSWKTTGYRHTPGPLKGARRGRPGRALPCGRKEADDAMSLKKPVVPHSLSYSWSGCALSTSSDA
jgi:hypothetical protein